MATSNGTGAAARPSPAHPVPEGTRPRSTDRAWLAGLAWLQGLTQDERDAALAAGSAAPEAQAAADAADPPRLDYSDDDIDSWWLALYMSERREVLLAGIASGRYFTPEQIAAGARPAHVGGSSPSVSILGNDRVVSCPERNIREIEAILSHACVQLPHDEPPQKMLGSAIDRLVAIREGRPYVEFKRPEGARMTLVYVKPADFERGVRDAELGIFNPGQMPAGVHRASWLLGVAQVLEHSALARERAGQAGNGAAADPSNGERRLLGVVEMCDALVQECAHEVSALSAAAQALLGGTGEQLLKVHDLIGLLEECVERLSDRINSQADAVDASWCDEDRSALFDRLSGQGSATAATGAAS